MPKLTPFLRFVDNTKFEDVIDFYKSVFPDAKVKHQISFYDTVSKTQVERATLDIFDQELSLMVKKKSSEDVCPTFNESISFFISCSEQEEIDYYSSALIANGGSKGECGWCKDRFGVWWQVISTTEPTFKKITPFLWFDTNLKDMIAFYKSVFPYTNVTYQGGLSDTPTGQDVELATFEILGQEFKAMKVEGGPYYSFNEAISLYISCDDQEEIDYYWRTLLAKDDEGAEVGDDDCCGWCKDSFGVSWQIVPTVLETILSSGNVEAIRCVTETLEKMKKFDINGLKKAFPSTQRFSVTIKAPREKVWKLMLDDKTYRE